MLLFTYKKTGKAQAMTPSAIVTGECHTVSLNEFQGRNGETISFWQITLITDDEYRPLMKFSVSKELADSLDFAKIAPTLEKKILVLEGALSLQSSKVGEEFITKLTFKVDKSIRIK